MYTHQQSVYFATSVPISKYYHKCVMTDCYFLHCSVSFTSSPLHIKVCIYPTHTLTQALEHTRAQRVQQDKVIADQRLLLKQALHQNNELRDRLTQIQSIASGAESNNAHLGTPGMTTSLGRSPSQPAHHPAIIRRYESFMSLQSSMSETFFDALDDVSIYLLGTLYLSIVSSSKL